MESQNCPLHLSVCRTRMSWTKETLTRFGLSVWCRTKLRQRGRSSLTALQRRKLDTENPKTSLESNDVNSRRQSVVCTTFRHARHRRKASQKSQGLLHAKSRGTKEGKGTELFAKFTAIPSRISTKTIVTSPDRVRSKTQACRLTTLTR